MTSLLAPGAQDVTDAAVPRFRDRGVFVTLATLVAVLAAAVPLAAVVSPSWFPAAAAAATLVVVAGWLVRLTRLAAFAVVAEALVAGIWVVASVPRAPNQGYLGAIHANLAMAADEIVTGVAPVTPSGALVWLLSSLVAIIAASTMFLVRTARVTGLAVTFVIVVTLIPSLAVPSFASLALCVPSGIGVCVLLWAAGRDSLRRRGSQQPRRAGIVAAVIATSAVLAACVMPQQVVLPDPAALFGRGGAVVDTSLDLGEDLRQPGQAEMFRYSSTSASPGYLRLSTLDTADGDQWLLNTDRLSSVAAGFPSKQNPTDDEETQLQSTSISVTGMISDFLPAPYPAVEVTGLDDQWSIRGTDSTIVRRDGESLGSEYIVEWDERAPTIDDVDRAEQYARDNRLVGSLGIADALPESVSATAREITAGEETAYEKLIALQAWFRGPDFTYSLDTPVEDGFDGTSLDAVERFLQVRAGYCIHFATAFALMSESLGFPTRVVVGFLPGTPTGDVSETGDTVFQVTSRELHAWPEVYFAGIGWLQFEPTASLGTPTALRQADTSDGPQETSEPTPSASGAAPSAPADRPEALEDDTAFDSTGSSSARLDWVAPTALLLAIVGLIVLTPAAIRHTRRARRLNSSRSPRLGAWREAEDLLVDAGVAVSADQSPAVVAREMVAHGAPPDAVDRLRLDAELAIFAGPLDAGPSRDMASVRSDLHAVRAGLSPTVSARLSSFLAPRSLIRRARSGFSETDLSARR